MSAWSVTDYWPDIERQGDIIGLGCSCDDSQDAFCTIHGDPVILLGTIFNMTAELTELKRRHQVLLDALDADRSTVIGKRVVRAILKER
jgi:hypothetical protein